MTAAMLILRPITGLRGVSNEEQQDPPDMAGLAGGRGRNVSRWCNVKLLGWEIWFLLFCNVIWTSLVPPRAVDWTWPEQLIWNWAFMPPAGLRLPPAAWRELEVQNMLICDLLVVGWRGMGLGPSIMQMKEIIANLPTAIKSPPCLLIFFAQSPDQTLKCYLYCCILSKF